MSDLPYLSAMWLVRADGGGVPSRQDRGAARLGVPLSDAVRDEQARLSPRSQVQAAQAHVRTTYVSAAVRPL